MSTQVHRNSTLSILLTSIVALLVLTVSGGTVQAQTPTGDPIYIGVSGPLTGALAQYGAQWIKGFDLALEEINGAGGIDGRPLAYEFEDSQSDPKQSVVVAQKFVADPRIVIELGDFSSSASMAASQIYQRGGLVQFGFTNSHPDFTFAGGDYTWSTSVTQTQASPALADFAVTTIGLKKLAVFQIQNDWGNATLDLFSKRVTELGAEIVVTQPYLDGETNFRSALTTIKDANPDGIILISYQADAALIAQQAREAGLNVPFVGSASIQSPDYITLGGKAVEGTYILGEFTITDPRPEVQTFAKAFQDKYNEEPDLFATIAYDAIYVVAAAIKEGGPTREGIHEALPKLKDVPSVIYGKITFDPETRRVQNPRFNDLIVKDGAFVPWDGKK
ncbi:MAG: ABC transporter substrate-binding protein [Anaerolineae bacterium]|nr:ABC transporter substrate-binding protein [Anaerolineae bacterium]